MIAPAAAFTVQTIGADAWFTLSTIYVFCFVVGLGYIIVAALLGTLGGAMDHGDVGGADIDADVDFDADFDGGFDPGDFDYDLDIDHGEVAIGHHGEMVGGAHLGPFSPLIIALFLTCFGGTGLLFTTVVDIGAALSVLPASGSSLVFAALAIWAFNKLFLKVEASSHARASDLIGRSAKVIIPLPEGKGAGQVAYTVKGSRYTATARSPEGRPIAAGVEVVIIRLVGSSCFVAPPDDKRAKEAVKRRARADAAATA